MIPDNLLQKWEREAQSLGVPQDELREFLKARERDFRESTRTPERKQPREFFSWDQDERVCRRAAWDFADLQKRLRKGFKDSEARENFLYQRERWFSHLLRCMREMKISKGKLAHYGLDFRAAQSFAHVAV